MSIKREANFGTLFRHYMRAHPFAESAAFELKQTREDSLPFSDVQPHQIDALLAVKHSNLLYKAPDDSRGVKPFDFFYMHQALAYVVIRYPDFFCIIDIDKFIDEDKRSQRRSLVSFRARQISTLVVEL